MKPKLFDIFLHRAKKLVVVFTFAFCLLTLSFLPCDAQPIKAEEISIQEIEEFFQAMRATPETAGPMLEGVFDNKFPNPNEVRFVVLYLHDDNKYVRRSAFKLLENYAAYSQASAPGNRAQEEYAVSIEATRNEWNIFNFYRIYLLRPYTDNVLLEELKDGRALPPLLMRLKSPEKVQRDTAAATLQILARSNDELRRTALQIGSDGELNARIAIVSQLIHSRAQQQTDDELKNLPYNLAELDRLLTSASENESVELRRAAARTLFRLRSLKIHVGVPLKHLTDGDLETRVDIALAAAADGLAADQVIPVLIEALRRTDDERRVAAARALGAYGPVSGSAVTDLRQALDGGSRLRRESVKALGYIGAESEDTVEKLQRMYESRSYNTQEQEELEDAIYLIKYYQRDEYFPDLSFAYKGSLVERRESHAKSAAQSAALLRAAGEPPLVGQHGNPTITYRMEHYDHAKRLTVVRKEAQRPAELICWRENTIPRGPRFSTTRRSLSEEEWKKVRNQAERLYHAQIADDAQAEFERSRPAFIELSDENGYRVIHWWPIGPSPFQVFGDTLKVLHASCSD